MSSDVAVALVSLGTLVVVLSSIGAVVVRGDLYTRLHFVTPVTSLGAPLIGLGLAVQNGFGLTTGEILLTVALLVASGPVLEAATGRVAAQNQRIVPTESPE